MPETTTTETILLGRCLYCEAPLRQKLKGRQRKFCDNNDVCRNAWREDQRGDGAVDEADDE